MSIQWFPGHMHKARKEVAKILPQIDMVIQVLDARIPYSSSNPMIDKLCESKPCLYVLTKSDLADPALTEQWLEQLKSRPDTRAMAVTTQAPDKIKSIIPLAKAEVPNKIDKHKTINILIVGIPNVGKSTLINTLAGKPVAKAGNEPAVTKGQQRINLRNGIMLFDTPGMLWPKVENENSSYRLAVTGAIRDTAMSYDEVAFFAAEFLMQHYPDRLCERFALQQLPATEMEFLEMAGKNRGCLVSGGRVDIEKISKILLNEIRSGSMGPLTLETPAVAVKEAHECKLAIAEKTAKKAARKEAFKKNRKDS